MVVAVIAGIVGLLTVVVACYRRDAALDPVPDPDPGWEPLPAPNDVARPVFPLALPGYDPATVDATMEALVVAYEELWRAAGPDALVRARRGAARRRGLDVAAPDIAAADALFVAEPPGPSGATGVGGGHVPEVLRAAAALAALQARQ